MTKYERFSGPQIPPRPWDIHPIWRGIGCILMLLIPVVSYIGADLLVTANARQGWVQLPAELLQTVSLPGIGEVPHLYANLVATLLLALAGYGVLVILFNMLYAITGPPRYGPLDMPPLPNKKTRR